MNWAIVVNNIKRHRLTMVKQQTEHLSFVLVVQHPRSERIIAKTPSSSVKTWNYELRFVLVSCTSDSLFAVFSRSKTPIPPNKATFLNWQTLMYIVKAPDKKSRVLHIDIRTRLTFYLKQLKKQQIMFWNIYW